jgi:hypothetical protein
LPHVSLHPGSVGNTARPTPSPGSKPTGGSGKGGAIAAGILVPLCVIGGAGFLYFKGINPMETISGMMPGSSNPLGNKFISTSSYSDDGTSFSAMSTAGGAASL